MLEHLGIRPASRILILLAAACSSSPSADAAQTEEDAGDTDAPTCTTCAFDERCIDGACVAVPVAIVSLATTTNRGGTAERVTLENDVCFYEPHVLGTAIGTPVMTRDACAVYEGGKAKQTKTTRGDVGVVTVKGGRNRVSTLSPDPNANCYRSSLSEGALVFFDGDTLAISASGGEDFPAFSTSLPAPGQIAMAQSLVVPENDLSIRWSGAPAAAGDTIDIVVLSTNDTKTVRLECTAPDTGSFTIPSSLTARLLEGAANAVQVTRERRTRIEPPEKVLIVVRLATVDMRASGQ